VPDRPAGPHKDIEAFLLGTPKTMGACAMATPMSDSISPTNHTTAPQSYTGPTSGWAGRVREALGVYGHRDPLGKVPRNNERPIA